MFDKNKKYIKSILNGEEVAYSGDMQDYYTMWGNYLEYAETLLKKNPDLMGNLSPDVCGQIYYAYLAHEIISSNLDVSKIDFSVFNDEFWLKSIVPALIERVKVSVEHEENENPDSLLSHDEIVNNRIIRVLNEIKYSPMLRDTFILECLKLDPSLDELFNNYFKTKFNNHTNTANPLGV